MFLDYFAGDFAAHARVMTTLSSVSAIVGFFLKPLFASMTDKYGRKPLLALSPILQVINPSCPFLPVHTHRTRHFIRQPRCLTKDRLAERELLRHRAVPDELDHHDAHGAAGPPVLHLGDIAHRQRRRL